MAEPPTPSTCDRTGAAAQPATTGHAYDGILEYDNPTPGWWTWLFIATIVFSAVYFFTVTLAGGQLSPIGFYDRARLAEMKRSGALRADATTLINLSKDGDSLKAGEAIYLTHCISCHARDGSGLAGPNLTDDLYIHVTKITDIVDVISNGRAGGAMPAWGHRLSPNEIVQVSAYVASLRGQNRKGKPIEPNAKPIPPWSE
jgi:cytochrome c oxidase cbb3-type subunit 3